MRPQFLPLLAFLLPPTTQAKHPHHHNPAAAAAAAATALAPPCSTSACVEYINTCGLQFGGCYAACPGLPTPTYPDPGCPVTDAREQAATTTSDTCTSTDCVDYVNECGVRYGGCYEACTGFTTPSFAVPGCATAVITPTGTVTVLGYGGITVRQVARTG